MAFLVHQDRAIGAAPPAGPVVDAQHPRCGHLCQRQGVHQPQQRHPTGRSLETGAQPSTRSTANGQPDLPQGRAERHGAASVARGQAGRLLGERLLRTAAIPTHEAANPELDHHRSPDGFVHEEARVAAVHTT